MDRFLNPPTATNPSAIVSGVASRYAPISRDFQPPSTAREERYFSAVTAREMDRQMKKGKPIFVS